MEIKQIDIQDLLKNVIFEGTDWKLYLRVFVESEEDIEAKAKVSDNDLKADYLKNKLISKDTNVLEVTEENDGNVEQVGFKIKYDNNTIKSDSSKGLYIENDKTIQKIEVEKNGTMVWTRKKINFIDGDNTNINIVEDTANNKINITISGKDEKIKIDNTDTADYLWNKIITEENIKKEVVDNWSWNKKIKLYTEWKIKTNNTDVFWFLEEKLKAWNNIILEIITEDWQKKIKIKSEWKILTTDTDTIYDYLSNKLLSWTWINLEIIDESWNKKIRINSDGKVSIDWTDDLDFLENKIWTWNNNIEITKESGVLKIKWKVTVEDSDESYTNEKINFVDTQTNKIEIENDNINKKINISIVTKDIELDTTQNQKILYNKSWYIWYSTLYTDTDWKKFGFWTNILEWKININDDKHNWRWSIRLWVSGWTFENEVWISYLSSNNGTIKNWSWFVGRGIWQPAGNNDFVWWNDPGDNTENKAQMILKDSSGDLRIRWRFLASWKNDFKIDTNLLVANPRQRKWSGRIMLSMAYWRRDNNWTLNTSDWHSFGAVANFKLDNINVSWNKLTVYFQKPYAAEPMVFIWIESAPVILRWNSFSGWIDIRLYDTNGNTKNWDSITNFRWYILAIGEI